MTADLAKTRFPWGLTIASTLLFVLLIALGVWQVQRMQWKDGLIARAEAAGRAPPEPPARVGADGDNAEFRRISVVCPGLSSAPYVELQTIHDGQPGVRLVSACRPPDFPKTFLVDRGFVADTISARPPVRASTEETRIIAQLRRIPAPGPMALPPDKGRFFARDHAAMASALGVTDPGQYTLFALTSSNPEWRALQPSAPPAAFSNKHLGYAITWFGLALALAGFYIALLRRKLKS